MGFRIDPLNLSEWFVNGFKKVNQQTLDIDYIVDSDYE